MPVIEFVGTPNFRIGRNGRKPIAIVNHITAGAFPGCLSWLQNPAAQASAHYLITKTGLIYQLVKDEDTAWHAGAVNKPNWPLYDGTNPNGYTIGIEHENLAGGELTEAQYQATLWLQKRIVEQWGIPVDVNHIIGHYRIDSVNRPNCPGAQFPWERLLRDLVAVEPDKQEGGSKKVKNLVLYKWPEDQRAAGYLADFLHCPVAQLENQVTAELLDGVESLYQVGGQALNSRVKLISGETAVDTAQAVLNYIKEGVR